MPSGTAKGQISKIKPPTDPRSHKPAIQFSGYKTLMSYTDQGFTPERGLNDERWKWQLRFLNRVDPSKPIRRTILAMYRMKVLDLTGEKKKRKEVIVYREKWEGKDLIGKSVPPCENIEGYWHKQISEPMIDDRTHSLTGYERTGEEIIYDIDFSKKKVDELIEASWGTDEETITFYVTDRKSILGGGKRDMATYDQFVNLSWDDCLRILMSQGGFQKALVKEISASTNNAA